MPKVLVTGGAGFIGSHIAEAYGKLGLEVVVVDDLSAGHREFVPKGARLAQGDIADPSIAELFDRERPDVVNHHAAQISVQASVRDPLKDARTNALGTLNLLECSRRCGVQRFIYASSGGAIYGEPLYLPCDEEHPVQPLSPYGLSKYAGELNIPIYHRLYGLEYVVLRYANVYGPRQDPHGEAGVVAIFTERMLRRQEAIIYGSGEQERDFIYVGDVVQANVAALDERHRGVYNIGSGTSASVNRIFSLLRGLTGYQRGPVYAEAKPGEVFRIALEVSRAREGLGWRPNTGLEEGLARTVEYFRLRLAPSKVR